MSDHSRETAFPNEPDPLTDPANSRRTRQVMRFKCKRCGNRTRTVVLRSGESVLAGAQVSNCPTCKGQTLHDVTIETHTEL